MNFVTVIIVQLQKTLKLFFMSFFGKWQEEIGNDQEKTTAKGKEKIHSLVCRKVNRQAD